MRKLAFLLLLGLLLSACGGELPQTLTTTPQAGVTSTAALPGLTLQPSSAVPQGPTATPATKINVQVEDLRGAKVLFWHPWSGDLAKTMDDLTSEFNSTNIWGITVSAASQGSLSGLDDALGASLTGSAPARPQVIALSPEIIAAYQESAAIVTDLQPYIQDPQWGLTAAEQADFIPSFWNEGPASGPRYALPGLRSMAFLVYNASWGKELGFSQPPATQADFRAQACAAAKFNRGTGNVESNGTGGWIVSTTSSSAMSWLGSVSALAASNPGQPPTFATDPSTAVFTFLRKLVDDSCAWTSRSPEPYNYFSTRMALIYSATLEDLGPQKTSLDYNKSTDTWTIMPYPSSVGVVTFGPSLAVLNSTPAQELASWLFVHWLELPRIQARLAAAGGLLPVRKSAVELMTDYAKVHPQWATAAGWLNGALQPLPVESWWRVVQNVLEDASGQVFQPAVTAAQIPDLFKTLDATNQELLSRPK